MVPTVPPLEVCSLWWHCFQTFSEGIVVMQWSSFCKWTLVPKVQIYVMWCELGISLSLHFRWNSLDISPSFPSYLSLQHDGAQGCDSPVVPFWLLWPTFSCIHPDAELSRIPVSLGHPLWRTCCEFRKRPWRFCCGDQEGFTPPAGSPFVLCLLSYPDPSGAPSLLLALGWPTGGPSSTWTHWIPLLTPEHAPSAGSWKTPSSSCHSS